MQIWNSELQTMHGSMLSLGQVIGLELLNKQIKGAARKQSGSSKLLAGQAVQLAHPRCERVGQSTKFCSAYVVDPSHWIEEKQQCV